MSRRSTRRVEVDAQAGQRITLGVGQDALDREEQLNVIADLSLPELDSRLCRAVRTLFLRALLGFYSRKAREDDIEGGRIGAVNQVQRFGSDLPSGDTASASRPCSRCSWSRTGKMRPPFKRSKYQIVLTKRLGNARGPGRDLLNPLHPEEQDRYRGRSQIPPDGKRAVVMRTKAPDERIIDYVESAPGDQLQPKLQSYSYLKPGDQVAISKPHLFDLEKQEEIPISDELFPNPWSLSDVRWVPDSSRFTFRYNQRGHEILRVVAVEARFVRHLMGVEPRWEESQGA